MKSRFPWWLFAVIAAGALWASGVYVGVMSVDGSTGVRMLKAVGFGVIGLVMLWGATHTRGGSG